MRHPSKRGVITKLPKKGDLSVICGNNRSITLLSIAGKVFCTLILLQIRDAIESALEKTQQYFALRQVVGRAWRYSFL